ncbi:hypothetical protein V6N13_063698 [Hibiscus sabdariffa]
MSTGGQQPADGQGLPALADGAVAPPILQNNQQQPVRTVRDYLAEDLEGLNPAVTMPEFEAEHLELKPVMFNILNTLGQFGGSPTENARQNLKSFLEICNSFKIHGVSNDVLKLKLFPYSLRDKITSFRQEDDEAMHEAWERYRDLFRRCPMHGLPEWTQVSIFYNSVNTPTRMMLDASANGTFLDKPPRESLEILDKLAQNDYQHPTSRRGITRRGPVQLDSSDTILALIASLTNMVKNMQKQPHIQEVKALDAFCELCGSNHDASECGQQVESNCYVENYNKNTMSNTYNPAWRNHPNFSWRNQNNTLNPQQPTQTGFQNQPRQNPQQNLPRPEFQQPAEYKSLENTLTQFMAQTSAYMARTDRFIQKTDAFMDRTPIGGFPSDTEVAKGATHEQCKAITTRSGKILTQMSNQRGTAASPSAAIDTPAEADGSAQTSEDHSNPHNTNKGESSTESSQSKTDKSEDTRSPPPFPQRLKKQKQDYQFKKFFDILKQVHINLPLVEALQQMPNYAKFLKDMVTRKKRIEEFETAAATETCLALMHNKKARHWRSKPTTVMLQLADHSYVQPEGKIEDILVQVDKFIFPADFLILDYEADEHAPIILGRPFLSTSRAIIDFNKDKIIFKVDDDKVKMKSLTKQLDKGKGIATTPAKDTPKPKLYMGAHVERDRTVMSLRDA